MEGASAGGPSCDITHDPAEHRDVAIITVLAQPRFATLDGMCYLAATRPVCDGTTARLTDLPMHVHNDPWVYLALGAAGFPAHADTVVNGILCR